MSDADPQAGAKKKGMPSSWWMEFLARTNLIVASLTACFVLYTQSAGVVYFTAGAVGCSITVKLLKRLLRHPRPLHPSKKKKTYGMPSTHSATITYFAIFIALACAYLPIHKSFPLSTATRILPPLIVLPWASLIAGSRIWLGHHTWPQVAVGCIYGAAFASLWFKLWVGGWNEYSQILEDWFHASRQ